MKLERWIVAKVTDEASVVYGRVYGSPKFEDGAWIHTSRIVALDTDNKWVKTLNSIYDLGEEGAVEEVYGE